jgi:hypothetical protein
MGTRIGPGIMGNTNFSSQIIFIYTVSLNPHYIVKNMGEKTKAWSGQVICVQSKSQLERD